MKALKEYEIPFVGLKEGMHDYRFTIDNRFFERFEYSEIHEGEVFVDLQMERKTRMMIFSFHISGYVVVPCDRCLADMEYPIEGDQRLIVKLGHERKEETDEILIIPDTDSHVDISGFIYEYIMLLLPYQRMHPEGEGQCDEEVIAKLLQHIPKEVDPRWEVLNKLKDNTELT